MKKIISVFLSVIMVLGIFSVSTFAFNSRACASPEIVTVSCEQDLRMLNKDIPVVHIVGFGETIYKGLLAYEEDDYQEIFAPSADMILNGVLFNIVDLAGGLIKKDYDKVASALSKAVVPVFGDLQCDENGVPNPNTGIKPSSKNNVYAKDEYGYDNSYDFKYDWRLDVHTLSQQLDEYINKVLEVTGAKQVALTAFSMGGCVLTTYLYEYYYNNPGYAERNHIAACVFISGAMNGVACCGEPFSGNLKLDAESLTRFMAENMLGDAVTSYVYRVLELLYSAGFIKNVTDYANELIEATMDKLVDAGGMDSLGTIPGFYALMSYEDYYIAEDYIFNTPEKREKYSALIEKNRYYHEEVQKINTDIIDSLIDDGINVGVIAEYGMTMTPTSMDNDRMADGVITTERESFGAVCSEVDGTLGEGYVQKNACPCNKNHISPDNQIDASAGYYSDITWFVKNIHHTADDDIFGDLVDLIIYSDEQINVFTYSEFSQFLDASDEENLVPITEENAETEVPFEETTLIARIINFFKAIIEFFKNLGK